MENISLTEQESKMLVNIVKNDYANGASVEEQAAVWADCLNDGPNDFNKASIPGIVGSLSRKGLVWTDHDGREAIVFLSKEGVELYKSLNLG